ncbi:MAG: FMN-binding protein, partial [Lachnospiraceae bacterium]|nr:FMN-binding protein [Lachnospiraceae bacterium]
MKDIIKNALILFVITLVAGVALGFVYDITKEPIAQNAANAQAGANAVVFEDAVNWSTPMLDEAAAQAVLDSDATAYSGVTFKNVLEAQDASGTPLGYVIEVGSMGYGDEIDFVIGIRNEGVLNGISIIS